MAKAHDMPANWQITAINREARARGMSYAELMEQLKRNYYEHNRILEEYRADYHAEKAAEAARIAAANKKKDAPQSRNEKMLEENWPPIDEE